MNLQRCVSCTFAPQGICYDWFAMRLVVVFLTVCSVFFHSTAFSASYPDAWAKDLDASQAEQSEEERSHDALVEDARWQEKRDLFPEEQTTDDRTSLERLRDERTAAYLSVDVGGSTLLFRDVPRQSWFAPYVRTIAQLRIVSGYALPDGSPAGLFGPGDSVTMEQLAKIIIHASGRDPSLCPIPPLNLTASGSWSAAYVSCAEQAGWAMYGDGSVDVHRPALRSEVIVSLLEAFDVTIGDRTGEEFSDVSPSTEFAGFIEQAKRDGIITGYTDAAGVPTGEFGPHDPVSRAELSKMIVLGMQLYGKK